MRLEVTFQRANDLIVALSSNAERRRLSLRTALLLQERLIESMIGNRIVQTLSCLACRIAASLLLHARVIELLESGLHCIGIRRWFLALLSLRPQLWTLLAAESF